MVVYARSVSFHRMPSILHSRTEVNLAPIVDKLSVSKTIEIHSLIKEMENRGIKVYSLALGEPDYNTPVEVVDATVSVSSFTNSNAYKHLNRYLLQYLDLHGTQL